MFNTIKIKATSAKEHVVRNRAKYAAAATLVACYSVHYIALTQWHDFLEEKGIDPTEFFCPEYFEELQAVA